MVEIYIEKKRERRIRDFLRMVDRAYEVNRRWFPAPSSRNCYPPLDTWEDVFRARHAAARRTANHLKYCSKGAHGCGTGRRHWGDRTLQEYRLALAAVEQLTEQQRLDDAPGPRRARRRGYWV